MPKPPPSLRLGKFSKRFRLFDGREKLEGGGRHKCSGFGLTQPLWATWKDSLKLQSQLIFLFDDRILLEYEEVLFRSKFGFNPGDVEIILEFIRPEGEYVAPPPLDLRMPDPDNVPFLEVAIYDNANFMITGNLKDFLYQKYRDLVTSPAQFLVSWHRS